MKQTKQSGVLISVHNTFNNLISSGICLKWQHFWYLKINCTVNLLSILNCLEFINLELFQKIMQANGIFSFFFLRVFFVYIIEDIKTTWKPPSLFKYSFLYAKILGSFYSTDSSWYFLSLVFCQYLYCILALSKGMFGAY